MTYPNKAPPGPARAAGSRSTAAVLWLMILIVFLPIAGIHAAVRLAGHEAPAEVSGTK